MKTAGGKVIPLPLNRLPVHLRRRSTSLATRLVGLDHIAEACCVSVDEIMTWYLEHHFPLRRQGKRWTTTSKAIEGWLLSLPKRYPSQPRQGKG